MMKQIYPSDYQYIQDKEISPLMGIRIDDPSFKLCPICLDNINKDTYETKCCNTYFHKSCFDEWVFHQNKLSCPICRHPYITLDLSEKPQYIKETCRECCKCLFVVFFIGYVGFWAYISIIKT